MAHVTKSRKYTIGISAVTIAVTLMFQLNGPSGARAHAAEVDGPEVTWLVSAWGNRRGLTEGLEALASELSDATDGNFTLDIQYGAALAEPAEALDGLSIGAFEAAITCTVYAPSKTPSLSALDLPFLPIFDLETRGRVHEAYFQHPYVLEELEKWNAYPLMSGLMPEYEVMGKGEAPRTLDAWEGLRMHATGGIGKIMGALGVTTMTLPSPETYQALERNVVDAVAFPFTFAFGAYGLQEVSDWYTRGLALGSTTCPIYVSKTAYDALPQQYRDLIKEAKPKAYAHQREAYAELDEKYLAEFDEAGLQEVRYPPEVREQILESVGRDSWDEWIDENAARGIPAEELLNLVLETANAE